MHKIFICPLLFACILFDYHVYATISEDYISDLYANYTFIQCDLISKPRKYPRRRKLYRSSSTNWAGYVADNHAAANSVTFITGTWIVPMRYPNNPAGIASIWVGIDGFFSGTVEQIGIEWDTNNSYAWYEMYPAGQIILGGFPFDVNDSMTATVTYSGSNVFTMTLANNSRGVFTMVAPTGTGGEQRNGCEWILERTFIGFLPPLTRICPCQWSNCMTTINGITGTINNPNWQFDPITMVNGSDILAVPSSLSPDGSSFNITWLTAQ